MFLAGFELVCGAAAALFFLFVLVPAALGVAGVLITSIYQRAKKIKLIWLAIPAFLFSALIASDTGNISMAVTGMISGGYIFVKFINFLIPPIDAEQNKKAA